MPITYDEDGEGLTGELLWLKQRTVVLIVYLYLWEFKVM